MVTNSKSTILIYIIRLSDIFLEEVGTGNEVNTMESFHRVLQRKRPRSK